MVITSNSPPPDESNPPDLKLSMPPGLREVVVCSIAYILRRFATAFVLTLGLLLVIPFESAAGPQRKRVVRRPPTRTELKQAERRLSEMGYKTGAADGVIDETTRNALVLFQKWEGRKVTGKITRSELDAIMSAEAPHPRDPGYAHVEDLD